MKSEEFQFFICKAFQANWF